MANGRLGPALEAGVRRRWGYGKPFETWVKDGVRSVRVGSRVWSSPRWRTFADFLFEFLVKTLGEDWWRAELAASDRHPIIQQYDRFGAAEREAGKGEDGLYSVTLDGAMQALLGLAYDLYLCAHNAAIPPLLVKRLKVPRDYEGALYETYVAGLFARAGFHVSFEDERDAGRSHGEFVATHRGTGRKFSVEAKAVTSLSARAGHSEEPPSLRGKLFDALVKDLDYDRIIFIELNRSLRPPVAGGGPEWAQQFIQQVKRAELDMQKPDGSPMPPAYLFVTNRPLLTDSAATAGHELASAAFKIDDFPPERAGDVLSMHRARLKHLEAYELFRAGQTITPLPTNFTTDPFALMLAAADGEDDGTRQGFQHPLDAFDFMFGVYHKSSEENLRKWLYQHYAPESLEALNQLQLAEIYCAGMAGSMLALRR